MKFSPWWEYSLCEYWSLGNTNSWDSLLNTKFLTFRFYRHECYRVKFHERDSIFSKDSAFLHFPTRFSILFCFRRNKLKMIKRYNVQIDTTFNVKRIFVYMLLRLHFRGFRTKLRSRIHKKKPTKKSKSNLVARKKNQSKKLRFPQPWDRSHRHLRRYLLFSFWNF